MRSFSIIIPFKTGKHYLSACINSVLDQNYPHYQIIVLTDNTSNEDGSVDYLKSLPTGHLEIVSSDQSLNILENWNRIKEVSKSEYMTILGYDDLLYPGFLEEINQLIERHPNASLYHTHFNYIDKTGNYINKCKPLPEILTSEAYLAMALDEQISIMATGYVFKKIDYVSLGGIDILYPNLIYADLQLWIELTEIGYLATSPSEQFAFRLHASTTKISKDKILMEALLHFLNYLKKLSGQSIAYKMIVTKHAGKFLEQTTKSIAHRILRTPIEYRQGMRINELVNNLRVKSSELGVPYNPEKIKSFQMAVLIEKYKLLNKLFLLFKSIYKKPIY